MEQGFAHNTASLAASISAAQRHLLMRYLRNALHAGKRSIPANNRKLEELLNDDCARQLLLLSGFRPTDVEDANDTRCFIVARSADSNLRDVLTVLEHHTPNLLTHLPDEMLMRVFIQVDAPDLSAFERVSTQAARVARFGCLWLRHCPPRFWREAEGLDRFGIEQWATAAPISFSSSDQSTGRVLASEERRHPTSAPAPSPEIGDALPIDWKMVYRLSRLWEQLRARCPSDVNFTLRAGLTVDAIKRRVHARVVQKLPAPFIASLMVHDGQIEQHGAIGLLFAGARLLSLDEIDAAFSQDQVQSDSLHVTTVVGFQSVALRCADGAVVMKSGFNEHVIARNWALFLERVMSDTV